MSRAFLALLTAVALLSGGGIAWAAWTSSGPGTVTARAGALVAPTATVAAWNCGSTATAKFATGGRALEAFPAAAPTTTTPPAPLAATTTTVPPTTSAAPATTTTTVTPTTSAPAPAAAASTTTTTVAPTTTSTSGVVTGLGAAATTLRWSAVPTAVTYQYQAATTTDFANPVATGTTGATSATVTVRAILPTTVSLRVRGVVGGWNGPWSPTLTTTAGPCLL